LHGEDFSAAPVPAGARGEVAVVGRREPDTDAVCSAIAYAALKNAIDPGTHYTAYRAGPVRAETAFVLERFGAPAPPLYAAKQSTDSPGKDDRKVVVLDSSGPETAPEGLDPGGIVEIIDHHRLEGFRTPAPVRVRIDPVGAAATIIFELYQEHGVEPDPAIAGLLCAAIISDTERFTAPHTTRRDRIAAVQLAAAAAVGIDTLASEMLHNKKD
jgi:manganese-dependent inorganic pyrophosphatase